MARTQSRVLSRTNSHSFLCRSIRLVAFSVIASLTLETSCMAGAQQGPPPMPTKVPSQVPQPQNTQLASNSPAPAAQEARNESAESLPSAPTPMPAQQAPAQQTPAQQAPPQQAPAQQQTPPQQPVGTAAAPYEKPTGVAGSRPAGAAIAPAKQRRVRAIVIRVGLVLAAGAAVGAVVGLSKATHSTPQ